MAKCTVTLNIAKAGVAYTGQSMTIADVVARDDDTYWTTTEGREVPLTNGPLATVSLDQGQVYSFTFPDGTSDIRVIPAATTADFSDLDVLHATDNAPTILLALDPTVYLSSNGLEPPGLAVGDYWFVDNVYQPNYGDLYQKTS